ncbi:sensor histidine kinase [Spelaeicoccus albus]|uniref:histidine kinase n=1 Tax=Spelaeicoccus albus TaxID=1280376 RepID=A0A7Z0IHL9_9MICO|nr:HAMP domain-containing sensor histidine kinase [Spelaeicoccus albus]NYI67657.1 signal transduction histidine kinase [Spelaeicoccus albus]
MTERRGLSARARILAWIMLIVSVAAVAIVVLTGSALISRVNAATNTELGHEVAKFRAFAADPEPEARGDTSTVSGLLTSYLWHNLPDRSEALFSIVNGKADRRTVGDPPVRLDSNRAFVRRAASATKPTSGTIATSAGKAEYVVVPVRIVGKSARGQLVIAEFVAPAYDHAWSTIWTMSAIAFAALVVAAVTGWFVAGRVLAPIRKVRETAARISDTDLGRRIDVVGSDDVGRLAQTFNTMLDRLETAFDGQRRFLNDAGHELRTPITVVRGHLEVMGDDPDEREQTMHLVDDELRRMSRIVDDLIMLARSERTDFVVPGPTDLTDLVVESFTKATALADRRWSIDETPEGIAIADGQRLTQALLQLTSNAVAHTGPGDRISMGGRLSDGRIRLWVADTGTGISPADHERIFERFAKASHSRRSRGTGLGLAIVSNIVEAHHGTVSVESVPGRGTTFTLELPWNRTMEGP